MFSLTVTFLRRPWPCLGIEGVRGGKGVKTFNNLLKAKKCLDKIRKKAFSLSFKKILKMFSATPPYYSFSYSYSLHPAFLHRNILSHTFISHSKFDKNTFFIFFSGTACEPPIIIPLKP